MSYRYKFPVRPMIIGVNDCAGETEAAVINLLPYPIVDTRTGAELTVPSLFISDGMSTPDLAQARYQADEGEAAGHTHDYLYSTAAGVHLDEFCGGEGETSRAVADEVMRDYLAQHCPGYQGTEDWGAYAGVRVGGASSFRQRERDEWRARVAKRLGGMPMSGRGYEVNNGAAMASVTKWLEQFRMRHVV